MKGKDNTDQNFEEIIKNSFKENDPLIILDDFATRMTKLLKTRLLRKRLFKDWGYKIAFLVSLIALFSSIIWFASDSLRQLLLQLIIDNKLILLSGLVIGLFVFFFDQVILKIMFLSKNNKG